VNSLEFRHVYFKNCFQNRKTEFYFIPLGRCLILTEVLPSSYSNPGGKGPPGRGGYADAGGGGPRYSGGGGSPSSEKAIGHNTMRPSGAPRGSPERRFLNHRFSSITLLSVPSNPVPSNTCVLL